MTKKGSDAAIDSDLLDRAIVFADSTNRKKPLTRMNHLEVRGYKIIEAEQTTTLGFFGYFTSTFLPLVIYNPLDNFSLFIFNLSFDRRRPLRS